MKTVELTDDEVDCICDSVEMYKDRRENHLGRPYETPERREGIVNDLNTMDRVLKKLGGNNGKT